MMPTSLEAQFYNGSRQTFGKNRVQFDDFLWSRYKYDHYNVYFNTGGDALAKYVSEHAQGVIDDLSTFFDHDPEDKFHIIVFNKLEHFRQHNIGIDQGGSNNIGGTSIISGAKVFVYFTGDHNELLQQLREGIAAVFVNEVVYGNRIRDVVKNSALTPLPRWYMEGLIDHVSAPWDPVSKQRLIELSQSGKLERINQLSGADEVLAGRAIWQYVAEIYGAKLIPNIVYMSRVSRNIESGFLFVLGISAATLIKECAAYHRATIRQPHAADKKNNSPIKKTKKTRSYSAFTLSPSGQHIAFAQHHLGKYKVKLKTAEGKEGRVIMKEGIKLDRIVDLSYPKLIWHPHEPILSMIYERKGAVLLSFYNLESKKIITQPILGVEKVLDVTYAPDGKRLVFSAMYEGKTDLYMYEVAAKAHKKLTDDYQDDFSPVFIGNGNKILFTSNRKQVEETTAPSDKVDVAPSTDLFLMDMSKDGHPYERLTHTLESDELSPQPLADQQFTMMSDQEGVNRIYKAFIDSAITHIDTAIHYRRFITTHPISPEGKHAVNYRLGDQGKQYTLQSRAAGRDQLELYSTDATATDVVSDEKNSKREKQDEDETPRVKAAASRGLVFRSTPIDSKAVDQKQQEGVNLEQYQFYTEEKEPAAQDTVVSTNRPVAQDTSTADTALQESDEFVIAEKRNYNVSFTASELVTQVDFNFANQLYQPFNGGPYFSPGLGTVFKIGMQDLFEDFYLEGGIRYSFSGGNTEYFLSYENRSKRLDKKYLYQRQTLRASGAGALIKVHINKFSPIFTWPFSEVLALRTTLSLRTDRYVTLSTNDLTAAAPDVVLFQGGSKAELIYDNTRERGVNILHGTRYKLFGEFYQEINTAQSDIAILGLDFRHYQHLHRNVILASRFSASTSFGSRKLVYYMGAVDDWVVINQDPDQPKFSFETPIATDQNYFFQTLATNMRGFSQNIRNGNSFALFSQELRIPLFRYLIRQPLKSDFFQTFQMTGFFDVGTAWNGPSPYSDENTFNTREVRSGSLLIRLDNQKDPIVAGYGIGARARLLGYFVKFDYAWGLEDGDVKAPITYLSMGLDF